MKTLCFLFLTVFLTEAAPEDTSQRAFSETVKNSARVTKSTKDYRKAKEGCLKKSEQLKGKKLTECIVNYQKEVK